MKASYFAQKQRQRVVDELRKRGPAAPTLCDGWNTLDLAVHLYVREHRMLSALGMVLEPLSSLTTRTMEKIKKCRSFDDLVHDIESGHRWFSAWNIPGIDGLINAVEYFIHAEDIVRASTPDHDYPPCNDLENDILWSRIRTMGPLLARRVPIGLIAEDTNNARHQPLRLRPGTPIVTIAGKPGEILLYLYGRGSHSDVELIGSPGGLDALARAHLRV